MNGHVTPLMIPIALGLVSSTTASAGYGFVGTVIEIRSTVQAASSSNAAYDPKDFNGIWDRSRGGSRGISRLPGDETTPQFTVKGKETFDSYTSGAIIFPAIVAWIAASLFAFERRPLFVAAGREGRTFCHLQRPAHRRHRYE